MGINVERAAQLPLLIQQGSSFLRTLVIEDHPATDYQFRGQIRAFHESSDVLAEFNFQVANDNQVAWTLAPEVTAALPAQRLVYDVEMYNDSVGFVARIIEGDVDVTPEVTR